MNAPWFQPYKKQMNWPEFNQCLQIDLRNKIVYFDMPKAACSTIKSRLQKVVSRGLPKPQQVHPNIFSSPFVKPFQLPNYQIRKILSGELNFFRFTFVREPEERIVSAYLDKICRNKPEKKKITNYLPNTEIEDDVSFDTFIGVIEELGDPLKLDKHWRPQVDMIFRPHQKLDFIGRIDRFETDWATVLEATGLTAVKDQSEIRWHATDAKSRSDDYVTPALRAKIEKIYSPDFELYASLE